MKRNLATILALVSLASLTGCDKIKTALGKSDDAGPGGGATSSTTSALAILNGFEGEIDIALKGKIGKANQPVNFVLDIKGDKLRADLPQGIDGADKIGKAYGIYNAPEQKIYFVMDAQKQVIVIDLSKAGDQLKSFKPPSSHPSAGASPQGTPPKITKTGKTDTVAGYSCEIWQIESSDPKEKEKAQVCMAEQGVSWFHLPLTGIPAEYSFMSELVDGKHFPLRFVSFDATGAEDGRVEVTKIDKKTLDANMFEPPAGYQMMDLGQMFAGGFGGPGARPGMPGGMPGMPGGMPPHVPPHGGATPPTPHH